MDFDYKRHAEIMNTLVDELEQISSNDYVEESNALTPICKLLRIAMIKEVVQSYNDALMQVQEQEKIDYRDAANEKGCDESKALIYEEMTENAGRVIYSICPYADAEDWSEAERKQIISLVKLLHVYHGRHRVMAMVEHLIYHDAYLDVYNLSYYHKHCAELMQLGTITNYGAAYFNLRRFSTINQQLGRERATTVMALFIKQLNDKLDGDEIICRIGGDNFAVLFRKEKLDLIIDHLKGRGIEYDEEEELAFVSATAGYYLVTENLKQTADIIDNANLAYNQAKNVKNEPYAIYSPETASHIKESKVMEEQFTEALQSGEFHVYYQPKVALVDYTLAGAEALCRWIHDGKMISPGFFIPVFEQSKAITLLDFYMLEHVCRDLSKWIKEGKKVVKTSVNFSRRHLGNQDLASQIISIIDRYEVPHRYLEIELTETTTDVDFKDLRKVVTELQEAGISTSVDDFGMGYSSLNLIKELPWNVLKIDKSFLDPVAAGDAAGRVMLGHVIAMAQEMGLECIVEGVETAAQVKFLKQHDCYLAQGFFFDKPLTKEEFETRLEAIQDTK